MRKCLLKVPAETTVAELPSVPPPKTNLLVCLLATMLAVTDIIEAVCRQVPQQLLVVL